MTDKIECDKEIIFTFTVGNRSETGCVSFPKHQSILVSWNKLQRYMDLYFELDKEDEKK